MSWRVHLDGAVYGQPLLVGTMVIAATENDSVYGLDQATGKVAWRTHVGTPVPLADLPCGNIDPLGITGTPVYDTASGLVYAVAETSGYHHVLVGVSVRDGSVQVERDIPAPDGQPRYDQQRPALTIGAGRVYVAFGGLAGDCGPYRGSVVGIPLSGSGPMISYVVPTPREGAVWATGGPVTGPDGTMYVSVGNGSETSTSFDDSDSVTALSPGLRRTGVFAPSTWRHDNDNDLDLGSTQPALLPGGMLLADGKSGTAYLVKAARLGGVGGQVAQAEVCPAYGQAAVQGSIVYEPCERGGLAAVDTAGNTITVRWRGPASAWGSPVLGGGAVWVTDWKAGTLYELDQAHRRDQGLAGPGNHAAALLVDVDDGQPRVPRHDGGRGRGRRRLTRGDMNDEARDGGAHGCRPGRGGRLQRYGRGRGRDVRWLGAAVQDADGGPAAAGRIPPRPGPPTGATSPAPTWPPAWPRRAG